MFEAPPEAINKALLDKAVDWLQTQPEDLLGRLTTKRDLVQAYKEFLRNQGVSAAEDAPVSTKNFRRSIKNVAKELDQFSDIGAPSASHVVRPPQAETSSSPDSIDLPPEDEDSSGPLFYSREPGVIFTENNSGKSSGKSLGKSPEKSFRKNTEKTSENNGTRTNPTEDINSMETAVKNKANTIKSATGNRTTGSEERKSNKQDLEKSKSTALGAVSLDELTLTRIQEVQNSLNLSSETETIRLLVTLGYERVKKL